MACKTSFTVVAAIMCMYVCSVNGSAESYYMEDYCTGSVRQIHVGYNGVMLYSQRGAHYENDINCTVTFYTAEGQVPMLISRWINLENSYDCIQLFDGQDTSVLPTVTQCHSDPLRYFSTQRYLTVQMTTDDGVSYDGFRISVIVYGNTGVEDQCDLDAFHCQSSHQCIAMKKVCNNRDDCRNGEDEDIPECDPVESWLYWSGGQVAGLIIGYLIFLITVIAIVVVVNRRCKK